MAEPLARLLFQHREFTSQDALRTAKVIAGYSWGVWAYCALPVIVRAYYAQGDRITPIRIGTATVALDFTLNLVLIWFMAETGLAISTSIGASLQVVVLAVLFSRRKVPLGWPSLAAASSKTIIATALMTAARSPQSSSFSLRPACRRLLTSSSRWPSQWRSTWPPPGSLKSRNWGSYSPGAQAK